MAEALSRHGLTATQAHGIEKQETCDNSPQRGGATREQQVALAKHMAHNVTTADRYYDKSEWREDRHECLDDIQTNIRLLSQVSCFSMP
jgi:hypothetical protein